MMSPLSVMSDDHGTPISPRAIPHRGDACNAAVAVLRERFGSLIGREELVWGETTVFVEIDAVHDVIRWLCEEPTQRFDYLVDITAVEYREHGRPLEVVWHLRALGHRRFLRLKVELPKRGPLQVPSIVDIYSGADWLERECFDMFGIRFIGHPDLRRILLWDSYQEGFPLRKDFPLRGRFSRAEQLKQALAANPEARYSMEELHIAEAFDSLPDDMKARLAADRPATPASVQTSASRTIEMTLRTQEPDLESDHMLINLGPQHPATHGVLRLVLELDGETVVRCIPHIGYLHCGFEKMGEYRQYNQIIPWTDREDYLNSPGNNVAFVLGAERLFGVECTPRATVLRVILMELSRIMSHVVWLGTTSVDIGAFTPFLWLYQERENIYNLLEGWVGARLTTSATRVGGMAADLPAGWLDGLRAFLRGFPRTLDESVNMLETNGIWAGRTVGLGAISAQEAVNAGLSGPMLRASGVAYDVRKDFPYLDYETYDFD
ncbi:MAG: NADH-quinone oxidoreductase subunit C, partial [Gemmatimonas sp.]